MAQEIIDRCFDKSGCPESLRACESLGDFSGYNLRLRIRDLASVVEADNSTHAGDIGRLLSISKQWALLAHGVKGLPQYPLHLTRFLVLLQDLPSTLALLIPSGQRANHWVGNDFWLETQNYWLKHFYSQSVSHFSLTCRSDSCGRSHGKSFFSSTLSQGNGTDIKNLIEISMNIGLVRSPDTFLSPLVHYNEPSYLQQLRQLGQQLKVHSGLKPVFQGHAHNITPNSLDNFFRYWVKLDQKDNQASKNTTLQIPDAIVAGTKILQKNILQDKNKETRYRWGSGFGIEAEPELEDFEITEGSH